MQLHQSRSERPGLAGSIAGQERHTRYLTLERYSKGVRGLVGASFPGGFTRNPRCISGLICSSSEEFKIGDVRMLTKTLLIVLSVRKSRFMSAG